MTQTVQDILKNISTTLDPEEVIGRLDISSEELVELIQSTILDNLDQFLDIYDEEFDVGYEQ